MDTGKMLFLAASFSRFGLAVLLLISVEAKISDLYEFVPNMSSLVGGRWAIHVAVAVVFAEAVAALLLFLPRTVRAGGWWTATLLIIFAIYALVYIYIRGGEPLKCKCFNGISAGQFGISTTIGNLVLLGPTMLVIRYYRRQQSYTFAIKRKGKGVTEQR